VQVEREAPLLGAGAAALPLLLDGARCHWAHTEAQAAALRALGGLMNCAGDVAKNSLTAHENRCKLFALGALDVAVTAMNAHVSERAVQAAACKMLGNITLSSPDVDAIRAQVGALGGIRGLMGALDAFPRDRDLAYGVTNALGNLMYHASNLGEVVASGGIERILEVLGTFADDAMIAFIAILALGELAGAGPAAQARLAALGVHEGVRAAMAANKDCREPFKGYVKNEGQELLDKLPDDAALAKDAQGFLISPIFTFSLHSNVAHLVFLFPTFSYFQSIHISLIWPLLLIFLRRRRWRWFQGPLHVVSTFNRNKESKRYKNETQSARVSDPLPPPPAEVAGVYISPKVSSSTSYRYSDRRHI